MSVESPPAFLQASTYGAEITRRATMFMLQRGASVGSVTGGIVAIGDCQLTPPGSGMSVNVAPGEVVVNGSTSATQSGYYGRVSSSTSLSVATSDPTNPRVDRVVAVVTDAAYSGVTNTFTVSVVTGTPTAGATLVNLTGAGAAPASSYTLGYVLVPVTATNIVGADISNVANVVTLGPGPPVGSIVHYAASSDPAGGGWFVCDGRAIGRTAYAALFTAVGTTYGSGDGSTTFNIPDGRGRMLAQVDGSAGRLHAQTISGVTNGNTLASTGGGDTVTPATITAGAGGNAVATGAAVNNMPPYLVVNHIIRVL